DSFSKRGKVDLPPNKFNSRSKHDTFPIHSKRDYSSDRYKRHRPQNRDRREYSPDRNNRDHSQNRDRRDRSQNRDRRDRSQNRDRRDRSQNRDRRDRSQNRDRRDRLEKRDSSTDNKHIDRDSKLPPDPEVLKKLEPNFKVSGKLAEDTNVVAGSLLKYNEPPDARKTTDKWRLYVFKDNVEIDLLMVHRSSAYLFGRDRKVADIPIDHPSCSGQHAVLQYRQTTTKDDSSPAVRPYLIDLDSTNGTTINGNKIPPQRFIQLFSQDVLKFGFSSREYVLLLDDS
ncbi:Smad nuclear interacting protein 1, partial [Smittium mucronatum]